MASGGSNPVSIWLKFALGLTILIVIFSYAINHVGGFSSFSNDIKSTSGIETISGIPESWSWLNYIFGQIPDAVIGEVGDVSALIIVVVIFIIFVLTFGDELSRFGFYSTWVGWVLGILLAILSANFKLIIAISSVGFMIITGVGVLSTVVGIMTPFIIAIVGRYLVLSNLTSYIIGNKTSKDVQKAAKDAELAIKGLREISNAFK